MRGLVKAALVVLSSVGVVVGVAPAAQAADFSMYLYGPWGPGGSATVCPAGAGFQSGQTVLVQVLEGGTWVGKRTYTAPAGNGCVSFDPTGMVPGPGTYQFQALSRVPSTGELVTTGAQALTLSRDDGRIIWLGARNDFQPSTRIFSEGSRLSTRSVQDRTTPVLIPAAHGQVVDLQRKAGSTWVNANRVTAPASGNDVTVRLVFPARPGSSTHRFVSRATAWNPTVVTDSFTVYQSAVVNKTSYIAEARSYMARYCPKTPIAIDTPAVASGGPIGMASAYMGTSRGKKVLNTRIELRSKMPPDMLRAVALHECGHVVQYRSMVVGRFGEVQRQAGKLWPGLGVEGQADCMSFQITRDYRYFGYVRDCSKAQLVNAARMWQTYGGKYQAASYRW